MEFLHSDLFLIILLFLNIILLVCSIISNVRIKNIYKKDKVFMEKLGDGTNIKEDLDKYMDKVTAINEEIDKLSLYYKELRGKMQRSIQKIGIVRYNAYQDVGSDLSFVVCLLDEKNNGMVFNGIYSRDTSNIYAKPINEGTSEYKLTPEEQDAIYKAINKWPN